MENKRVSLSFNRTNCFCVSVVSSFFSFWSILFVAFECQWEKKIEKKAAEIILHVVSTTTKFQRKWEMNIFCRLKSIWNGIQHGSFLFKHRNIDHVHKSFGCQPTIENIHYLHRKFKFKVGNTRCFGSFYFLNTSIAWSRDILNMWSFIRTVNEWRKWKPRRHWKYIHTNTHTHTVCIIILHGINIVKQNAKEHFLNFCERVRFERFAIRKWKCSALAATTIYIIR